MAEDKIRNLLQKADEMAGEPVGIPAGLAAVVRQRARHRRFVNSAGLITAAAVLVIAAGLWYSTTRTARTRPEQKRIAALEGQIQELQARTDATLNLIREVLEDERHQSRLDGLEAELASIRDPLEEVRRQVDRTAFILIYEADQMYRDRSQRGAAIQAYKRVIGLFPENRWAEEARQKLSEIEKRKTRKLDSKGELL